MHDVNATLVSNGEDLAIHRTQEIPDDFIENLRNERYASRLVRASEQHCVASVPAAVVEIWLRQGFDIFRARPKDIVAKLRKDNLEAFIATGKTI